ncbi:MAG: aspartate kinase, partial [Bacteroidota bacterium]
IELPYSPTNEKIISAQGELISTALFQILCQESGVQSSLLPALEFMKTNEDNCPDYTYIKESLPKYLNGQDQHLFITQGYICKDAFGHVSNLGRGGSDYTATIIGAMVKAEEIQIWTDIDGIHNNDPRYVKQTELIREMSFDEAANLAFFGAKILHPACVTPAQEANVPVRVKNTFDPYTEGTLISHDCKREVESAISSKDDEVLMNIVSNNTLSIHQFYAKVFDAFKTCQIEIDMMSMAHQSFVVVVNSSCNLGKIVCMLRDYATIHLENDLAIVNIIGACQKRSKKTINRIITATKSINVRMISQQRGEENYIRFLVRSKDKIKTLQAVDLAINHNKRRGENQVRPGVA